ncbi:DUF5522 domain-containing protein [Chitinophaga japonensis]|uniref:Uncharacterized protein n=1 Tax=Chitinophaga japonensis TaxID=104662 RepID=A0A562TF25_CHIJA|nr:DUF5522 domain-containing protein [Chitinophaga japonensis]TWI91983.1 hypothetical protein LX66_1364 [Chitinophaga japonensis]
MQLPLKEHIDFYYNRDGYMVFTEKYHLERGYCCGNGCKHCPFDYENVPEQKRARLLAQRRQQEKGPD